uniref:Uncharacterized protein n=1 Tax=Kalanchoe fedtschenkoi TaxID=63787 RepID=A0A7N1A5G9_KALFE
MGTSYRLLALFVILFLLQRNLRVAVATRPLESHQHTVLGPPVRELRVAPSLPSFTINRYKKIEADAFRPTSSGHSPGVGHYEPPTALDMN